MVNPRILRLAGYSLSTSLLKITRLVPPSGGLGRIATQIMIGTHYFSEATDRPSVVSMSAK